MSAFTAVLLTASATVSEYSTESQHPNGHKHPNGQGCLSDAARALPYCDTNRTLDDRLDDLATRLTIDELAQRLISGSTCPAVDKIGLPELNYRVEAIHGLEAFCMKVDGKDGTGSKVVCPTYFPTTQGVAATFNRSVFSAFGSVIGREARVWTNLNGDAKGQKPVSPSIRSPMVNILRDPRWGRSDETASECPLLSGEFGRLAVEGIQQRDKAGYYLASAEVKHFAAYNLETNAQHTRDGRKGFDAVVSAFDWQDTYAPPFAACLRDGRALAYMCSYNAVNGTPACANTFLSEHTARGKWGFEGFIESDCDAVGDLRKACIFSHSMAGQSTAWHAIARCTGVHLSRVDMASSHWQVYNLSDTDAGASALALNAGTDLDCGKTFKHGVPDAVAKGLVTRATLERAFRRAMRPLFLAGMFDGEGASEWHSLGAEAPSRDPNHALCRIAVSCVCNACRLQAVPAHRDAALDASYQSLVLLKNEGGALPFAKGRKVALVGPLAFAQAELVGPVTIGPCPGSQPGGGGDLGGGYKEDYSCIATLNASLHASGLASEVHAYHRSSEPGLTTRRVARKLMRNAPHCERA